MPNWCLNNLILKGSKEVLEEIQETNLSLQKLFPCPQELLDNPSPESNKEKAKANTEKYGYPSWYEWNIANWGTKWDIEIDDLHLNHVEGDLYHLGASFSSAWDPPVEAMQKLYERYKDRGLNIYMEFLEAGLGLIGTVSTLEGSFVEKCYKYSDSEDLMDCLTELEEHGLGESELEYLENEEMRKAGKSKEDNEE